MSIIPSGPPKKRGSTSKVYRSYSRRGLNRPRPTAARVSVASQEFVFTPRQLEFDLLEASERSAKAKVFNELLQLEKKLDREIDEERKRVQKSMTMSAESIKGILRIHVYNTVNTAPDDDTPVWSLRVQGRLVYPDFKGIYSGESIVSGYLRKFSSFFKKILVVFPDGERKEWNKNQMPRETDGIEIKRRGNIEMNVKIFLYLDSYPIKFKLSSALARFLGAKEETQENILQALWEYIHSNQLQDSEEKRFVNNDSALYPIFLEERTDISTVLAKIRNHLTDCDPIEINHQVILTGVWTSTEHLYDISVDLEDPLQYEIANYLKTQESIIFADNAFTNVITMLKAAKKMDIPRNPVEIKIKEINEEIGKLKKELDLHVERAEFAELYLKDPKGFLEELHAEQDTLRATVFQTNFYDKIHRESELDTRSSTFYQQQWVKNIID